MRRWFTVLLSALVVILATRAAPAENFHDKAAVPVVVVENGRAVETEAVDEIVSGLGAPVLRGQALAGRLGLVTPLEEGFAEKLDKKFQDAQNAFFSGQHEAAKEGFSEIIADAAANPGCLLTPVRELVFKAHLYLAILAKGEDDLDVVNERLAVADEAFPDLAPSSVDFPPWLRKMFDKVRSGRPSERNTVSDMQHRWHPDKLRKTDLRAEQEDLILEADASVTGSEIEADVLSIARSGGWNRIVVVVGRADGTHVALLDTARDGPVRNVDLGLNDATIAEAVATALVRPDGDNNRRRWYKDGLAWTLVGVGVACLSAGTVVARKYGSPSKQEQLAWPLLVAGGGALGTGALLFVLPRDQSPPDTAGTDVVIGVVGRVSF